MKRLFSGWLLGTVVLGGGLLAVALWPSALAVDVTTATRGPLRVTIDDEGETRVRERFIISAPVSGYLARINHEPGDPITRGTTVLALLTPAEPTLLDARSQAELTAAVEATRAALGQAQAERERAVAALALARSTFTRQEELADAGVSSRDALETSQTARLTGEETVRAADFNVARAEYNLQLARARLQPSGVTGRTIRIMAPIDGVVLKRFRESEAVVPAGEPLLEIASPDRIEIVADVLSANAVQIAPGDPVEIQRWGGETPLLGRVHRVEPSGFMKISALGVEEQRVNIIIHFVDEAHAARNLGDGYRVEVKIGIWEEAETLIVPVGSLFRHEGNWAVFVIEEDIVRLTSIALGQRNDAHAQVIDGLVAGTQVVLHPPNELQDGMRITPR